MSNALKVRASRNRANKRYDAPALDKGLDILELFATDSEGYNASEVARRLGRTVGEIFRMLVRLEQRGYVCQMPPDDRYFLTLKLFEIAHRHSPLRRLVLESYPLLQDVTHKTEQSCHLSMVSNGEVVVVAQADAPGNMSFSVRVGARIDLLNTASGNTILAFQDVEGRDRLLTLWQRESGKKIPRGVHPHLTLIRERGYEELPSHQIEGIVDIGFPVLNQQGEAIAAMTIPFLPRIGSSIGISEAKDALLSASHELSSLIGATPAAR
jgi:DNA-binding IclR family transcriptional regulator